MNKSMIKDDESMEDLQSIVDVNMMGNLYMGLYLAYLMEKKVRSMLELQ